MADANNRPAVSHNPRGIPPNHPPPTQQYTPPPNPSSTQQYAPPSTPPQDPTGLTEEAPPAYTTRPDVYQGESTVEYGPSRPFQPAPPPVQQLVTPAPSLWQQLTGQSSGGSTAEFPPASWSAYPGSQSPNPSQAQQQHAPPPQPTTHVSDFARDFYATTSVPPSGFSDVSGARATVSPQTGYPPPPVPPPAPTSYQPLPGAPPRSPSPSSAGGGGLPDDGRPTTTPVAGHPLLRDGNILVYPPHHHECSKCNNTGYKHADPAHPCSRCWSKYARPYAGAAPYAPSSTGSSPSSSSSSTTFQRPLPRLYAPPRSPAPGSSSSAFLYPPPANGPSHRNRHGRGGGYPGTVGRASGLYPPPPPANAHGAVVYAPGDVRLGGAPCWRCGGRGKLAFLVFETVPCTVCRGVGRVYG
ncbi:hypothetical protein B0H13DRAFT_1603685 [Mycena leptocephala]|nr:hypothetical protein B0H13DRAFT_1603685 [Mycena leptocephala]